MSNIRLEAARLGLQQYTTMLCYAEDDSVVVPSPVDLAREWAAFLEEPVIPAASSGVTVPDPAVMRYGLWPLDIPATAELARDAARVDLGLPM